MPDYDFHTLNDKEFEALTIDLLSAEFDVRIERFKAGADGGVDGRFFIDSNKEVIIQCKHWLKSGIEPLTRALKKEELPKVKKISPTKYIIVTSLELSRKNKTDIQSIFTPYIKNPSDIFGKEDLNALLSKHHEIEKSHYKL